MMMVVGTGLVWMVALKGWEGAKVEQPALMVMQVLWYHCQEFPILLM
jgi:hypothetical protein